MAVIPRKREGARTVGGMLTYATWDEVEPGTEYEGWIIRFENGRFSTKNQHIIIEDLSGNEICLNGSGKLTYCREKANLVPGNYIVVTYLGKTKVDSKKSAFAGSSCHDFSMEILDANDKSREPRFGGSGAPVISNVPRPQAYPEPQYTTEEDSIPF